MEKSSVKIVGVDVLLQSFKKLQGKIKEGKIPLLLASDLKVMIIERLKKGLGTFTAFEAYSTTPYYRDKTMRPVGKGGRRKSKKGGRDMATIFYEGGYADFVNATKSSNRVTLMASGAMIRDMQAMVVNSSTARLVFNQQKQMQKALQLSNIKGTFMGANPLQQAKLSERFVSIVNNFVKSLGLGK